MKSLNRIALDQFERRLDPLRKQVAHTQIQKGWINYIRTAMRMSLQTLSKRTKTSPSAISNFEKRERQGKVTLETLRKIAHAMDSELLYAIVPKARLKDILQTQARAKAKKILLKADTHMALEDQAVTADIKERIDRLAEKLIEDGDIW